MAEASRIDVLILTAADGEPEGVREVTDGRAGEWRLETDPPPDWHGKIWRTAFVTPAGRLLEVALAQTLDQGPQAAANACGVLTSYYQPQCLAMPGVCAGHPHKTRLGDVVLAERLYRYDQGAQVATTDGATYVEHDVTTYRLGPDWLTAARELRRTLAEAVKAGAAPEWLAARPPSLTRQEWWVLATLERGGNALGQPEHLPDRKAVLERLKERGWIQLAPLRLSDAGRQALAEAQELHGDDLLREPAWELRIEPMGTGEKLVLDPRVWEELIRMQRHTAALEMEGAAVGYAGWAQGVPRCLVVKGVMDNGDPGRTHAYRAFAARASAEVLLRFLRENLEPGGPAPSDLLRTGIGPLPASPLPSHLLTARHQAIQFQQDLAGPVWEELLAWTAGVPGVEVRLFTGPGGAGKTRLFQELALHLRDTGRWDAGFLIDLEDPEALATLLAGNRPALVIVDYAESHRHRDALLQGAATAAVRTRTSPLRIVLLARHAGDWWSALKGSHSWDGLLDTPPQELPEVELRDEARVRFFRHARAELGRALQVECDAGPPDLRHERFGRPLYLALAALAQLRDLPTGAETLLETVLEHESKFWVQRWPRLSVDDLCAYLAAVTLLGGIARVEAAEALVERLGLAAEVRHLRYFYPGRTLAGQQQEQIGPLEPDLLGETLVAGVLGHPDARKSYLAQTFAGAGPEAVEHGLTILGRLELRHARSETEVAEWYRRVLVANVSGRAVPAVRAALALGREGLSFTLGGVLAEVLAERGTTEEAEQIEDLIRLESTTLQDVAVWCHRRLLDGAGVPAAPPTSFWERLGSRFEKLATSFSRRAWMSEAEMAERAGRLMLLGGHLSNTGQREAALAATEEAVGLYRRLVAARGEAFLPHLAGSVDNLGIFLDAVGRREEALAAAEEGVAIRHRLAAAQPDAFLSDLATSLNNLGNSLDRLGRREEALGATKEAVGLYRRLVAARPEAFEPNLAGSLNNLGVLLDRLGRPEEALAATEEAVALYRRLATARPDAFLPDVAMSLGNLGNRLDRLGRREAALAATEEAVALYRRLATARPEAFGPNLAMSLSNLGVFLDRLGRPEEALAATEDAVAIFHRLAAASPEAFLPNLAAALSNLDAQLYALGREEEALAATEEALAIRRRLAAGRPDAFLPDLATSLWNRAVSLAGNRTAEAAESATEALGIYTTYMRRFRAAFEEPFRNCLKGTIQLQRAAGRDPSADPVVVEAVKAARELGIRLDEE